MPPLGGIWARVFRFPPLPRPSIHQESGATIPKAKKPALGGLSPLPRLHSIWLWASSKSAGQSRLPRETVTSLEPPNGFRHSLKSKKMGRWNRPVKTRSPHPDIQFGTQIRWGSSRATIESHHHGMLINSITKTLATQRLAEFPTTHMPPDATAWRTFSSKFFLHLNCDRQTFTGGGSAPAQSPTKSPENSLPTRLIQFCLNSERRFMACRRCSNTISSR